MKSILGALIISLAFAAHAGAQTKTDRELAGLRGPVKSVRVEQAELAADGLTVRRRFGIQLVMTYDEQGKLVEEASYGPDGRLRMKFARSRDADGRMVSSVSDAEDRVISKTVFTYDAAGRITGWLHFEAGDMLASKTVNVYDGQGRLASQEIYRPDGSLKRRLLMPAGDGQGQKQTTSYRGDDTLLGTATFARDGNRAQYEADGALRLKVTISEAKREFDAHGNWIRQAWPQSVRRAGQIEDGIFVTTREISYY